MPQYWPGAVEEEEEAENSHRGREEAEVEAMAERLRNEGRPQCNGAAEATGRILPEDPAAVEGEEDPSQPGHPCVYPEKWDLGHLDPPLVHLAAEVWALVGHTDQIRRGSLDAWPGLALHRLRSYAWLALQPHRYGFSLRIVHFLRGTLFCPGPFGRTYVLLRNCAPSAIQVRFRIAYPFTTFHLLLARLARRLVAQPGLALLRPVNFRVDLW
jgi:hypothetical protein